MTQMVGPVSDPHAELHLKNHFVRWACVLTLVFFSLITGLIASINNAVLHHPHIVNGPNFELALYVLVAFISVPLLRHLILWKAQRLNAQYLARFNSVKELGAYKESLSRIHLPGEKPYRHAVLLLHGFTASPQEFHFLVERLEAAGLPYLAPMLPGFGREDARVLHTVHRRDWVRAAVEGFDLLDSLADEVSVVGHSLGGMLGVALARHRKPKHLVLSAPGLYPVPSDQPYKKVLTRPFFSGLYVNLVPYLPKPIRKGRVSPSDTLDADYCRGIFQFLAVPIRSVKQLFLLQNETDITKVRCDHLSIIFGAHDLTVDMDTVFKKLDEAELPYQKYEFKNSAHNVLEDFEREDACNRVMSILTHS
jgi:esterase/lipase